MPRKNSNHLWSEEKYDFKSQNNIALDEKILENISEDSKFYNSLSQAVRTFRTYAEKFPKLIQIILKEEEIEKRDDNGELINPVSNFMKMIFNFNMFLYFCTKLQTVDTKYDKRNEFDLGNINCIRDNNIELLNPNWDRSIINKINILFYDTLSIVDISTMIKVYFKEFPEELRMFELIDKEMKLSKCTNNEVEKDDYKQEIIRVKEGKLIKYLNLTRLFDKILESEHPYDYKVSLKVFPTIDDKDKIVYWDTNRVMDKKDNDKKVKNFKSYTAEELFGIEVLESKHNFLLTRLVSENEERKNNSSNNNELEIDIKKSANGLDSKLIKNGYADEANWEKSRLSNLEVRGIQYYKDTNTAKDFEDNIEKVEVSLVENIVGMLGAGKSTFAMLAINDLIDKGKIVAVLEKDVASCVKLIDTLRKIGVKATLIKGEKRDGGRKHLEEYCKNVSSKYTSIMDFNEAERENLKLLDTTSTVKKINEIILEEVIDGSVPEMIKLKPVKGGKKPKRINYVNPEYLTSGVYHKYRELEHAQVIVLNYSSFLKTKAPYCLDVYERDFFTIISKIADVVIVDEVDMAMVRCTENYIGEMNIASTEPDRNQNKYFNDYMEVTRSKVNKQYDIARNSFTRNYNKIQGNQVQIINELLPFPYVYNYQKILNKPFTKYSLVKDFYTKYFDVENQQIYCDLSFRAFYNLFSRLQTDKNIKCTNDDSKTLADINKILTNVFTQIHLGNLDIFEDKDIVAQECADFLKLFIEYAKEEQNKWNVEIKEDVYRKIIENENKDDNYQQQTIKEVEDIKEEIYNTNYVNDECLADFLFLLLQSNFDINQKTLTRDAFRYLQLIDKSDDIDEITGGVPLNKNRGIYSILPKALIHEAASYRMNRNENRNIDLTMTEYNAMGNKVLLDYNQLFEGIKTASVPNMIFMSATSYTPHSTMYHNNYKPNYMIINPNQMDMKIKSRFIPIVFNNELVYVSGQENKEAKKTALNRMVKELTKDGGLFDQQVEKHQIEFDNLPKEEKSKSKRRVIALPVPSFELAEMVGRLIDETKYSGKVRVLYKEGAKCEGKVIVKEESFHITKDLIEECYKEDFDILVFVMTSIGRGYNILQGSQSYKSLIGSMFFLIRPYLAPDSITDVIHTLHGNLSRIIRNVKKRYELNEEIPHSKIYKEIIGVCHKLFDELMSSGVAWDRLDSFERTAIVSNFMVLIYQTIGRGLRGGTDLDVFFVDGKFIGEKTREQIIKNGVGENYEYKPLDDKYDSFLSIMEMITDEDDLIVQELYSKFAKSLKGIALKENV